VARRSEVNGVGLFATQAIPRGERIGIFGGYVIGIADMPTIQRNVPKAHDAIMRVGYMVDDDAIYSPIREKDFSDLEYINHSCNPNCGFSGQIHLVSINDIEAGSEITLDYAMCITDDMFAMSCNCSSEKCRGGKWR
jgi:uncharacterized protein